VEVDDEKKETAGAGRFLDKAIVPCAYALADLVVRLNFKISAASKDSFIRRKLLGKLLTMTACCGVETRRS
jgi:hypothetical protein